MPPFVPRKRPRSPSPAPTPPAKRNGSAKSTSKIKPTLFDAVDAPNKKRKTLAESKQLLADLNDDDDDNDNDDDDDASLSDIDSDEFEDVPPAKRSKTSGANEDEDESEDDMDWEDAIHHHSSIPAAGASHEVGDVSITINEDSNNYAEHTVSAGVNKKGPSKRERQVRIQSHCLHVQALLWQNTVRNSWLNDKNVQRVLVDGLTEGVKREVTRWREAMGTLSKEELNDKKAKAAAKASKGKRGRKSKDKAGRDWNREAEHVEQGVPNLAHGDPLLRLLKVLAAYWRKRFTVTAPGIRKQGYKSLKALRDELKGWSKDRSDAEQYGERVESIQQFRKLAKDCEGSRDVGAQLFVALLRSLGVETRMVANLQPIGFGWSKAEEADDKKANKKIEKQSKEDSDSEADSVEVKPKKTVSSKKPVAAVKTEKTTRRSSRGNKAEPIDLDESDSPLSSAPSAPEVIDLDDDDDLSVMDITPPTPKNKPAKKYDRDLAVPAYWVEVCSPVTNKWIPADPIVLSTIASNDELLQTFEPRGKKAEKAKQVICYTIAFAADGTAKDVTVRYLKKHQLPGKTKGMRMPAEKVPIYNRKGKVKRYEEYDWFRTVMSTYDKPEKRRTAADDLEEQTDLKPFKPAKEAKEVEKESLQWYKQSAEFVLEQHLRREEALIPGAKTVKTFLAGKGDKVKECPVYRRQDVVACKTVESWHKEGRALKSGQHPMKLVTMRAVTLIRKREMEDALRETGEKLKQGLYSVDQTDWIIPPPIKDGVIPKNAFGNMDVYVPTMVPKGAVHLPLKGTPRLCRKLEIDYAEACTGFEFGKQRAVPVLTGVVVAEEHELLVRDAWKEDQKEIKRKEDTKRTAASLHWWRKMLLGLRVLERMRIEYADAGGKEEEYNPFVAKAQREGRTVAASLDFENLDGDAEGGGFFPPGHDEEEVPQRPEKSKREDDTEDVDGGGFLMDEDVQHADADGGFLVEEHLDDVPPKNHAPITPVSLQSMHKATDDTEDEEEPQKNTVERQRPAVTKDRMKPAVKPTSQARSRPPTKPRRKAVASDDEEESALSDLSSEEDVIGDSDFDDGETRATNPRANVSSPRVVLTPQSSSAARGKKVTPRKSQYFHRGDTTEEVDDEGDDETEAEVVKPRRTTKRTRVGA